MAWLITLCLPLVMCLAVLGWLARAWYHQRQETSRLRDLLVWRSDQVSMLSHELRTPLTLIKLSSDLLAEDGPPLAPTQESFLRTIREQASVTIQLAEDLLTQSRIESGKFTLHLTTVDLSELVLNCVHDLRELHTTPIMLDCPTSPCRVQADAVLIRQGIANLVNNAVAVSPRDEPVTVRVTKREYDALVSVTDHGAGMSARQRSGLFQRFNSGQPVGSGTGLGLVITKHIIELHTGQLFVDAVVDRGTTMMFNLPIHGPSTPMKDMYT